MGIEAGTDEDQLRLDLVGGLLQGLGKSVAILLPRSAEADRLVNRVTETLAAAGFVCRASPG